MYYSGFCPVTLGGIEIETSGNGVCFTMHRPESSALLEVQLVVNLCQIDDCPTPSVRISILFFSHFIEKLKHLYYSTLKLTFKKLTLDT